MKIENEWYWFDFYSYKWYRYPNDIQELLKKNINKDEVKLRIKNKDYIFNFVEGYDLEIKTGSMITIKNDYLNELYKIMDNIKRDRKLRMDKHIYHNILKKENKIESFSDSEEEWDH